MPLGVIPAGIFSSLCWFLPLVNTKWVFVFCLAFIVELGIHYFGFVTLSFFHIVIPIVC